METIIKDVVNFGLGAYKTAEERSEEVLSKTQAKVSELIDLGAAEQGDNAEAVRSAVNTTAKQISDLQEQAESFVEKIVGQISTEKETEAQAV